MNSNTFSNPSIGLPGKVKANDPITLGESRFVTLPKLHWLSPIVATEIKGSGCVIFGRNDELDIPNAEAITLEELLVFVRQLYSEHSSAKQNVTKGKLVPLLVAEIVRCPKNEAFIKPEILARSIQQQHKFADPLNVRPRELCHELLALLGAKKTDASPTMI
ncbi:hypothetical protein PsorP6_012722 [Peronosclerospora sorghi]|uniref:Uncharacterized protein n=1 Tax=Peronosclerospora sorghi TaxID=230839 RepID=A0ACC0WHR0_9STRA|nr:hypothetical protein PsorP6_012722 [Peronosclerospora sorghi]